MYQIRQVREFLDFQTSRLAALGMDKDGGLNPVLGCLIGSLCLEGCPNKYISPLFLPECRYENMKLWKYLQTLQISFQEQQQSPLNYFLQIGQESQAPQCLVAEERRWIIACLQETSGISLVIIQDALAHQTWFVGLSRANWDPHLVFRVGCLRTIQFKALGK